MAHWQLGEPGIGSVRVAAQAVTCDAAFLPVAIAVVVFLNVFSTVWKAFVSAGDASKVCLELYVWELVTQACMLNLVTLKVKG